MKLYISETEMTKDEAEAYRKDGKRLITASEFFKIPKEQYDEEVRPHTPLRIENGLLVRGVVYCYFGGRGVFAFCGPDDRFRVLLVEDKAHKHRWVKQLMKCECGEEKK